MNMCCHVLWDFLLRMSFQAEMVFATLQRPHNPGVESIVISFAQKTFANGQLTSKLHVIELGAPAGNFQFLAELGAFLPL